MNYSFDVCFISGGFGVEKELVGKIIEGEIEFLNWLESIYFIEYLNIFPWEVQWTWKEGGEEVGIFFWCFVATFQLGN